MTTTNMVLVDGIAGSGKSSMVHRLGLHLRRLGYNARWFFDAEPDHPIYPDLTARVLSPTSDLDDVEWNEQHDVVLRNWKTLTSSLLGTKDIVLLDSSFSETPAEYQRLWNRPAGETVRHILEVDRILEPLNPILVYLYQRDVGVALREILTVRSQEYADYMIRWIGMTPYGREHKVAEYEDVVAVFAGVRRLTDEVFEKVRMRKIGIEDGARDWERSYGRITEFLGAPWIENQFGAPGHAHRLAGEYRPVGFSGSLRVNVDGTSLSISGVATLRLIPETDTVFHVQGTRVALEFEVEKHGRATGVKVFEAAGEPPTLWHRV